MKKIKLLFTALMLLVSAIAFGQNITVVGVVRDAAGAPLPGAGVVIQGTTIGVATGNDGEYSISVPANATLVFQLYGFKDTVIPVNGQKRIDAVLEDDSEQLESSVIVGYGSARKVGNIVGAISTVKSDVVKNAPSASALDLLQGQVAGMQVLSTGGVAGDNNISMKIHGVGSLSSSSAPLFIVDGIQSSSGAVMAMNPNDILSVTVLKDASSTSIYGAQGANGVVFVTTKSGQYDKDAVVTITSQYGISTLANMQFYENMMSAAELKNFWMRSGLLTADQIYNTYTSKGWTYDTKWHNYFQRFNNPQYQNDVTIEGGSKKIAYLLGASQFHQDGNTVGNFYDRYTVRSNIQARPKEWLKVGLNLNGALTSSMQNDNWGDSTGQDSNYLSGGLSFLNNPLYPAVDPATGKTYEITFPNGLYNPYYYFEKFHEQYNTYRITASSFVEIDILKNLKFNSRLGTDAVLQIMDRWGKPSGDMYNGNGMVQKRSSTTAKTTITNTLEWSFNLGEKNEFVLLAGQEGIDYDYQTFTAYGRGMTDDRYLSLNNATQDTKSVGQSRSQYRFLSFFGHADYNFDQRFFLDLTVRNDASSRFGEDHRNGLFWAVGGMWKMGQESFINNIDFINDLNLRASYGTQGNANIPNYQHLGIISALSTQYNSGSGIVLSQPSNEDLMWESQSLLTVGFDARVLDAIDVEFAWYDRRTTDMLLDVPQSYTTGFNELTCNTGELSNSGIDLTLGFDILKGRDYYFNAHATFGYNMEKVTKLFNGLNRWEIANTGVAWVVGSPVMFYYPIYAGVDPADGKPMWYLPAQGDPIIDPETGLQKLDDEGNPMYGINKDVCTMDPTRTTKTFDEAALTQNTGIKRHEPINGGFGFNAGWKGLFARVDFAYVLGKYLINNDAFFYANPNTFPGMNQHKMVSDFWTPYNTNAKFPDWSSGAEMQFDTHILENASFLRLKSLVLGYTLPENWMKSTGLFKSVTFTLTGRNLLTLTKYTGMDPEVDSNLAIGIPGNTLQVLGGVEIKF
ncbi:MAG: SusC/RagA family TonB-linked outer membrane protein [Bacteroidales bacterium]|nr:SusC/RagA family TonB-linked outer membrane protein [Bacteroidales bacterium]